MELLQNISIIVAACTAIYGITAWRREHAGKRRMDLAEEVLTLFYEARDVIQAIRHPMGFGGEGSTREGRPGEAEDEKRARDAAYVVFERYEKRQELFNRIRAIRYRYMAVFGKDASKPFDDLSAVIREILSAGRKLARMWSLQRPMDVATLETFRERLNEAEEVFWDTYDSDDPISPRVDNLIEDLERFCGNILRGRSPTVASRVFNLLMSKLRLRPRP